MKKNYYLQLCELLWMQIIPNTGYVNKISSEALLDELTKLQIVELEMLEYCGFDLLLNASNLSIAEDIETNGETFQNIVLIRDAISLKVGEALK